MAIYTDGSTITPENLRAFESAILDVASTEGIDITSKLALAHQELGFDVLLFLAGNGYDTPGQLGYVLRTEAMTASECYRAIELSYVDAYSSRLNDRYAAKRREYTDRYNAGLTHLMDIGVGLTSRPLPRPRALAVSAVAAGSLGASSYWVAAVRVGHDGEASALSEPALIDVAAGEVPAIASPNPSLHAQGWAVYASPNRDTLARQTPDVLPFGTPWQMPASGLRNDLEPLVEQGPEWFVRRRRILRRG